MNEPKIEIGIIDDHELFLEGLSNLLEKQPIIAITFRCKTISELKRKLNSKAPRVILLDYFLGYEKAESILYGISKNHPFLKIIILTTGIGVNEAITCFKSGVSCILPKDINIDALTNTIIKVNQDYQQKIEEYLHLYRLNPLSTNDYSSMLTQKEKQILSLLCDGKQNKQIAELLELSDLTIATHRKNIKYKLRDLELPQIIKASLKL